MLIMLSFKEVHICQIVVEENSLRRSKNGVQTKKMAIKIIRFLLSSKKYSNKISKSKHIAKGRV